MRLFRPTPIEVLQGGWRFKDVLRLAPRRLSSFLRVLPDFIIIGAHKSGTTALYDYLSEHPHIIPASDKEIHFFDLNYAKGLGWYRARFPTSFQKFWFEKLRGRPILTGEASPYYILYPHAPTRVKRLIPRVKIIALLRNPIDRAYSHYHHEIRKGRETLPFADVMRLEPERLKGEWEKIILDEKYISYNHNYYSHLCRGVYVDQIANWHKHFPKEQMLIIRSEDFFEDTPGIYRDVLRFLGLPFFELKNYRPANVGGYTTPMDPVLRARLVEYFRPHNRRLEEYLGRPFDWDH